MNTLEQLKEQDIWCKEEHFNTSTQNDVFRLLREMGMSNLAELLADYAKTFEHIETIKDHFCESLETVAGWCEEGMLGHLEDYIHMDYVSEYCGCEEKVSAFTSTLDDRFSCLLEESVNVRHKLGHFILNDEAIDEIRDLCHQCLREEGLE